MTLDINLSPLYRVQGNEPDDALGTAAFQPPQNSARGREQDRLIVYLALVGNAVVTTSEYRALVESVADAFYQTPHSITNALRAAASSLNQTLLNRNLSPEHRGEYALAWLALAALREQQCIFSLNGPVHAYSFGANGARHYFEPTISGRGAGASQTLNIYYAQAEVSADDLLLFCGRVPDAWNAALQDAQPTSFAALRRRLTSLTSEDLNAALIRFADGTGLVNLLRGTTIAKTEEPPQPATSDSPSNPEADSAPTADAHFAQPSAYPQPAADEDDPLNKLPRKAETRDFPASIPRAKPKAESSAEEESVNAGVAEKIEEEKTVVAEEAPTESEAQIPLPRVARRRERQEPAPWMRQAAKGVISFMQSVRVASAESGERLRRFLPRLLPDEERRSEFLSSASFMGFLAAVIPLIIVTIAIVIYLRFGRNEQYETYYNQAAQLEQQALKASDPVEQRVAWENVLENLDQAEKHSVTSDSSKLRQEAQTRRDQLLGILRMQFSPAFSVKPNVNISRMAASESGLYLLDAEKGEALRAVPSGNGGFELDATFNCKPGVGNPVGHLVDILTLPLVNIYDATLLGIDAGGNLLYCKPGATPQTGLPPPPDTNWGRVTRFFMNAGNLYVLDAPKRAVWVYVGKESAFVDRPYFFFGQQTPTQDAIDFVVSGDEMYLLHSDGRVSFCSYSRINTSASNCQDPVKKANPFPAYKNLDLFGEAHFTQILFAAPPDPSLLLLDAEHQTVMRFAPRAFELQNQFQPTTGKVNPIPPSPISAVTVSPDHVLYLAADGQVYFSANMP
ncbi:MAG: hypothetical protein LC099_10050 [Anaerolineales bacterium]|nr:hypothetical protein [Anaerolineales bacterium]